MWRLSSRNFLHRWAANRPCIPIKGGQNGIKSSSLRTPDILLYGDAFYLSLVRMCAIGICRVADMGTMAPPSESILWALMWERNSIIFSRYMDARMSFPLQRRNLRGGHLDEGRYGFCYLWWQHDRYLEASWNTLCYPKQSEHIAYVRSVRFIV
jgi:hypothetical protein